MFLCICYGVRILVLFLHPVNNTLSVVINCRSPLVTLSASRASGDNQPAATTAATNKEKQEQSVTGRKAKAVYPCEAEHESELSFQVGAIFSNGKCYLKLHSLTQNLLWNIAFGERGGTGHPI
ncbi:hypothetical protein AMECASPLE_013723 [Ameca splendens]|uniref:Uncharacterized protein n=2 Tax=Goodeidae TaxID=28758 RepID=A0ABV1A861_9TELE